MRTVAAVVPAHNEAARIAATVRALLEGGRIDEVVVVDDGSSDETASLAERAGARVIRLGRNRGKGAAVAAGVGATNAEILLLCDADLEASAGAVTALLDHLGPAGIAVAAPPRTAGPSGFGLVESLARWGIERLTGSRFDRPLSGQRAVRRGSLPALSGGEGFGLEVGMTIDALRAGVGVVEVEIPFRHARTGRNVAGFAHRARQGIDVARALIARRSRKPAPSPQGSPR